MKKLETIHLRAFKTRIIAGIFLVALVISFFIFRHKPKDQQLLVGPQAFDPSIYHKYGSNNDDAIKDGEWYLIMHVNGELSFFPSVGSLRVEAKEDKIYEDKGCVFQFYWDKTEEDKERDPDRYARAEKIWKVMNFRDKDKTVDVDVKGLLRIYQGKRRIFEWCSTKQKIIYTMPEDVDKEVNMWQILANPTPTPSPVLFQFATPIVK